MVLLDQIMPGLSGDDTYSRMRELNSDVKVVRISGDEIDVSVLEVGVGQVQMTLPKPFTEEDFWHVMRVMLDEKTR